MNKQGSIREQIALDFAVSNLVVEKALTRAPHTYKNFHIRKKNGKLRPVSQPARETKYIQKWLIKNYFSNLTVHSCATAYQKGSSIRENCSRHSENPYLLKMDFENFFPSIKHSDLVAHFAREFSSDLTSQDITDMSRACCIADSPFGHLALCVGAPSSPIVSNSIMFQFDTAVFDWCNQQDITYTRYADDLVFSTKEKGLSKKVYDFICSLTDQLESPKLKINNEKTAFLSKAHSRRVTGLVIANTGQVSIGRARKREISSLIHKYSLQQLPDDEVYRLQGLLGFVLDAERDFFGRMSKKYGAELLSKIMKTRSV